MTTLSCTPPATDPEIAALARGLNYNFFEIYEYVYDTVEFSPTFGSKKGALGTYLDRRGNNFDQNVLFVTLLRQSCHTADYRLGTLQFTGDSIANLFGVQNDIGVLNNVVGLGGIPGCAVSSAGSSTCATGSGPAPYFNMTVLWTEATNSATGLTYDLNPSFKSHTLYSPINMATATGYSRSSFLSSALTGSSSLGISGANSVKNVNRANITSSLNTYAESLANTIKANYSSSTTRQIFGGREINANNYGLLSPSVGTVYTELPEAYETIFDVSISDNPNDTNPAAFFSRHASQVHDRRLTLTYNSSHQPVAMLDGQVIATGSATSATQQTLYIKVTRPYVLGGADTVHPNIKVNGTYAIMLAAGEVGPDAPARHLRLAAKYTQAGSAATSEAVLGETVAAMGATYLSQTARASALIGGLGSSVVAWHDVRGIAGFDGSSSYVDFPGQVASTGAANTSVTIASMGGQFAALSMYMSSLESTAVTQIAKTTAASTVMMFDKSNDGSTNPSIGFVQATPANWNTVKASLTNWGTNELTSIGTYLASDPNAQVVMPQDGHRTVGTWTGNGYYTMTFGPTSVQMAYLISGGYKGAFSTGFDYDLGDIYVFGVGSISATIDSFGDINSAPFYDPFTESTHEIINGWDVCLSFCGGVDWTDLSVPQYAYPAPASNEPINLLTGAYTYNHSDISVGSQPFPLSLSFDRTYDSSKAAAKTPLGNGWRHNFMITAALVSDSDETFGDHNPLTAVATATVAYVMTDLMSDQSVSPAPPIGNTVSASLSASWLMDQLRENAVALTTAAGSKKYIKIPTSSGTGTYVPPPGDASVVAVNASTKAITVTDKSKNVMSFAADGTISTMTLANSQSLTFSYNAASGNNPPLLHTVVGTGGRSLTLNYDGSGMLTSVSDGTRSVSYTYDSASNLATYTDSAPTPATTTYAYVSGQPGMMTQIFYPSFPTTAFMTNTYDDFGYVKTQADTFGNVWNYLFANGTRSQEIDPAGGSHVLYYDRTGNQTFDLDQVSNQRVMVYDGQGRIVQTTYPNGDSVSLAYDAQSNVLTKTTTPIPGVQDVFGNLPPPIVQSWTYDPTFNKVLTATDGLGNTTTNTYDTSGNLLTVTQPPVAKLGVTGLVSPVSSFTWNSNGLMNTSTDAEGRVTAYTYDPTNLDLLSVTRDNLNLKLTTSYLYDGIGNRTQTTDPKGNVTTVSYDGRRLVTQINAPLSVVTTLSYDPDGRTTSVSRATGNTSSPWQTTAVTYNAAGLPVTSTQPDGTFRTSAYDTVGRLSTDTSSSGRQVLYTYDLASRITAITDQVSGALDPSITVNLGAVVREQRTYFADNLLKTVKDGKGNQTSLFYDGFKRVKEVDYPGSPVTDELYGYDANNNQLVFQTRSGAQIWLTYDALNRRLTKAPDGESTISYSYDYTGLLARAADPNIYRLIYDTAGRLTREISPTFGTTIAVLDKDGNTTRLTWPATAGSYIASSAFDALNRMTSVTEGTGTSAVRFAGYIYNPLSQRTRINFGVPGGTPVATTIATYTPAGLAASIKHTWNGSSSLVTLSYGYNQDQQRTSLSATDNTFLPSGLAPSSTSYTSNALNQYSAVNGTTFTYDARGNLTSDGVWTFGYDTENRLISASKTGTTATYAYDPFGRRLSKTVNGTTTAWSSFGGREIAEYQGPSGGTLNLVQRFVYGPGLDEPLAAVDAASNRTYHFADAKGSVIGLANASGQLTEKYTYTAYGTGTVSGAGTAVYRYTGRRYDGETGLYHYRARAYSPVLGRFLQTDPIGTQGGIHLYAYVGNDPLNRTDSTGLWFGVDDAVFSIGGGLIGAAGQLIADGLVKHEWSSGRDLAAAFVGGAVTAETALYAVPTMGPAGAVVAGAAGGAAMNLTGYAIDKYNDPTKQFDAGRLAFDVGVGAFTGGFSGFGIAGVNVGRNSFNAIFNQITTKAMNGSISSITAQTAGKMFLGQTADAAFLQGAITSGIAGDLYDSPGFGFINEAQGAESGENGEGQASSK